MQLAHLQSELQKAEGHRTSVLESFRRICSLQLAEDPRSDILRLSKGVNELIALSEQVPHAEQALSVRALTRGVALAPMAKTNNEDDFV